MSYANLKSGAEGVSGEGTRFSAKKKRALETVSTSRKKHQPTVISSADGASKTVLPEDESSSKGSVVSYAIYPKAKQQTSLANVDHAKLRL